MNMPTIIDRFEFWVVPKDDGDYVKLGVVGNYIPEMDSDFLYYREEDFSVGVCGVRKDAITAFKVVAVKKE